MMALQPFFSLTPSRPQAFTYDSANPSAPYASGYLASFGGFTSFASPYRLGDQNTNDEIIVGYDPVDLADQTIGSLINDLRRRCTIQVYFVGYNVTTANQYLLLFALRRVWGSVSAQFFVGADLVRTEQLSGDEQVAILMDTPGSGVTVHVYVRLASPDFFAIMGFQGMDCYLL